MVLISPTGRQKGIKIDGIRMADQFCGIWHSDSSLKKEIAGAKSAGVIANMHIIAQISRICKGNMVKMQI